MFRILQRAWMGAFLLAATGVSGAEPISSSDTQAEIRARVYDYAGVSPTTLVKAKAVASEVLGAAGARVVWADCQLRAEDPAKDAACALPMTPADLLIRVIDKKMADGVSSRDRLGFARHVEGFDWLAAAYFHKALELEKRNLADRSVVLGAIMAHEIGHLLLDDGSHSSQGIMRPLWSKSELKQLAQGRMRFTPEQALKIAQNVAARRR